MKKIKEDKNRDKEIEKKPKDLKEDDREYEARCVLADAKMEVAR